MHAKNNEIRHMRNDGAPTIAQMLWVEGNYRAYAEDLHKRKGTDADQPHRIAYKKLVRA